MRRRLELRDLRSLERRSMYSIFHPLDPDERLPRELILEGRRHRLLEIRTLVGWVGALYLPALLLIFVVLAGDVNTLIALAVAGLGLMAVYVYVVTTKTT